MRGHGITYTDDANELYEDHVSRLRSFTVQVHTPCTPESTYTARVLGTCRDELGLAHVRLQPCDAHGEPVGPPLLENIYHVRLEVL